MAHEILSLKLCELEDRLGRLNSRIHISETADHDRLKQEIKALSDENAETELTLRNKLDLSKSEMVKIFADAYTQINHILETTNSKIERQAAKEQTPESTAESLDPALTRPGRFDRRVPVELPDLAGREAILKVHAKKITTAEDVDFHTIARMAAGASGAELANIINEAALRAVRNGRTVVNEADLEESIEVVIAGYQKKNSVLSDREKKIVAYHEIGHALVAAKQSNTAPVQKITIIPRTSGALGYTMQVDTGDKYLLTREEIENKIATYTGGRAAEEVAFGTYTTGASNDIEQATKLARAMITRYGMSDEFDMVAMETVENQYLGGDASLTCSPETQQEIDRKVVDLIKQQHKKAKNILESNRDKLDELANFLYEKETITGEKFMEILNGSENA